MITNEPTFEVPNGSAAPKESATTPSAKIDDLNSSYTFDTEQRPIGSGQRGSVYEIGNRGSRQPLVAKIIYPNEQLFPEKRIVDEARLLARLIHPNILTIVDFGKRQVDGKEAYVLVFPRMENDLIKQQFQNPQEIFTCAREILDAVEYLHSQGFIHKDIKPDNIFVEGSGKTIQAYLADFGEFSFSSKSGEFEDIQRVAMILFYSLMRYDIRRGVITHNANQRATFRPPEAWEIYNDEDTTIPFAELCGFKDLAKSAQLSTSALRQKINQFELRTAQNHNQETQLPPTKDIPGTIKTSYEKYNLGTYGEKSGRVSRSIPSLIGANETQLHQRPTLNEATDFIIKEYAEGQGFNPREIRYESGIRHPITQEALQKLQHYAMNFECSVFGIKDTDGQMKSRFVTGFARRAEASSHYPRSRPRMSQSGELIESMLITDGLAIFDEDSQEMSVIPWEYHIHTHPENKYLANSTDLRIILASAKKGFAVSEEGILEYGGHSQLSVDDLIKLGLKLKPEDEGLAGHSTSVMELLKVNGDYFDQIFQIAKIGPIYDSLTGEDAQKLSNFLRVPYTFARWGSPEAQKMLDYINGEPEN
jgi:hypothetical protein